MAMILSMAIALEYWCNEISVLRGVFLRREWRKDWLVFMEGDWGLSREIKGEIYISGEIKGVYYQELYICLLHKF